MATSNEKWIDRLQFSSLFWPPPQDAEQRKVWFEINICFSRCRFLKRIVLVKEKVFPGYVFRYEMFVLS